MKERTHPIMKMKILKKEGSKPSKKFAGKLSKKTKLQDNEDDRENKGAQEQKTLAKQAILKVKIEETIQDEFVVRRRTRSSIKKTQEEEAPQAGVEISEDMIFNVF